MGEFLGFIIKSVQFLLMYKATVENYISVDSRRVFLQDRTTFITQKRQARIQMADFSIFLGNHVRPITDPLTLRFLLFVIHNQKDLN